MSKKGFVLVLTLILLLTGCKSPAGGRDTSHADEENAMTFKLSSPAVSAGENVVVCVNTQNNPGFLTMALTVDYDEDNMCLTWVENGADVSEYSFIPPKNLQSGCRMSWFVTDLNSSIMDGELLRLHFLVFSDTPGGEYPITVSPINDGGIVDGNKNAIKLTPAKGVIKVD